MKRLLPLAGALVALALPSAAVAQGPSASPQAVAARAQADVARAPNDAQTLIVRYKPGVSRAERAAAQRAAGAGNPQAFAPHTRTLRIRAGQTVAGALTQLRTHDAVAYAVPNYVAHAAYIPNDPGRGTTAGAWTRAQWNFRGRAGVNAPVAWDHLIAAGRPGAQGVVVAVLDTGVAYATRGPFRRSPDFTRGRFVRGYDFVDNDPYANDQNGHGTHVAGTIAESADNGVAMTGLAYGATIMPVRVLDSRGDGDAADISAGIRFAARNGADVINLSLEFGKDVRRESEIPGLIDAIDYAENQGVTVVGASGNESWSKISYPARYGPVISVGATTEHQCVAEYANIGPDLDIVAPGGGVDSEDGKAASCQPAKFGRDIYQLTLDGSLKTFGFPGDYEGTSMAAPHVSATAALIIASGVLGPDPTPAQIEQRLKATARDLGPVGQDRRYGAGLVDAAAATDPAIPPPPAPAPAPAPVR